MARQEGFEPLTPGLETGALASLSYWRTKPVLPRFLVSGVLSGSSVRSPGVVLNRRDPGAAALFFVLM